MAESIAIWGKKPPPIGGVSRSIVLLRDALTARGFRASVVDARSIVRVVATALSPAVLGAELHIFNVSSFRSASIFSQVPRVLPGFAALFLHGTQFVKEYEAASSTRRRKIEGALDRFDGIWVTNSDLADLVNISAPHATPSLVSPFPTHPLTAPPGAPRDPREPAAAVVGAYAGLALYGVDIAIEALRLCRENGTAYTLDVVLYGPDKPDKQQIRAAAEDFAWIRILEDLEPEELAGLLSRSALLLRPTERDGDSLLVREALAAGCRVIASDVVPRPKGVEVAPRRADAFAHAIREGGRLSNGDGLGMPADLKVQEVLGGP